MNHHQFKSVLGLATILTFFHVSAHADSISAGYAHTAVVTPAGVVWTWGQNVQGQLGNGTTTGRVLPGLVDNLTDVVAVAAGQYHTLVLLSDGTVKAWGDNNDGQLGDGTTTDRTAPVVVPGLSHIAAIAAGNSHSVALTDDGHVWTWGKNLNGQLGDGTTTTSLSPVLLTTLSGVSAIAAGGTHTIAIKSDGSAWAWGKNTNGQLGDGTTTQRTSPTQMTGVTSASAAAGGESHSLVLKADGTLYAVGLNTSGQLGDNTTTQRTSVVSTGLTGVTRIDAGVGHSIAIKSDGTLWTWGNNTYGDLGDGTTTMRKVPAQVGGISNVALAAAGDFHTFAVTTAGVVWSWGQNLGGSLGDGSTANRASPDTISGANYAWKVGVPLFSVDPGTYSTVQTVFITSATANAEIHYTLTGDDPLDTDPLVVAGTGIVLDHNLTLKARAWAANTPSSSIAAGAYTFTVTAPTIAPSTGTFTTPQVVSMSMTTSGATIRYTTDGTTPTATSPVYSQPFSIDTTTVVSAVGFKDGWTASSTRTAALTMNYGTLDPPTISPAGGTFVNAVDVTLTPDVPWATVRYTVDGTTPVATSPAATGPVRIETGVTLKAKSFHPDFTTSAQVQASYTITLSAPTISPVSGTYDAGQLITVTSPIAGATVTYTLNGAEPTSSDPAVPSSGTLTMGNFLLKVKAFRTGATTSPTATADYRITGSVTPGLLAAGDQHSLAVRSDGVVWAWGYNLNGQLGLGSTTNTAMPTVLSSPTGVVSIAAGENHSLAVTAGGAVYAWGLNNSGRLGDGTTTVRKLPTLIAGLTASSVAVGGAHSLAVAPNGSVWSWGYNFYGQLGDGTTTTKLSPAQLSGLSNISRVAAGTNSSAALSTSGSVWTWGRNNFGQLATGNTTDRSTPGQVTGISTATAIASGANHVLVLLADGTLRAWGYNGSGRLGDGTTTQRTSPVTVSTLTNVIAIAAGADHSMALKGDGTVWTWGYNGFGQIGDGTTTTRTTPVQVPGLPQIQAIAGGGGHSLALGADGSVWAWGQNTMGQIGDTTTTSPRKSPVQIANAGMFWKLPNVVLGLPSGRYFSSLAVTVTSGDSSAVIHYTTNGVDPTESDPTITSGSTVAVDQSLTLKAKAWKTGFPPSEIASGAYELKVVTPVVTPASGRYTSTQTVSMSSATPSTTLRYTVDGVDPTASSTVFSSPLTVSDSRTVKAIASRSGWTTSDVGVGSFWILEGPVTAPTITPAAATYQSPIVVKLTSAQQDVVIRYRLDGTDPDETSAIYRVPLLVARTTTVKARAFKAGSVASSVTAATFTFDSTGVATPPTISSSGGQFVARQTVTITGPAGATIRYTTTGVDPTDTDPVVPAGGLVTLDRAVVLKARSWQSGLAPSPVSRADFVITGAVYAGGSTLMALGSDGTLWAWGSNIWGNIGDGTTTERQTPVAVLTGVRAAAMSGSASFAIKEDGTLWAWGKGGALGDGTGNNHYSPVHITSLSNVVAVAAGFDHTLAITSDGKVWAWGDNDKGQLGDGTTTRRDSPVQVIGIGGAISIAAGQQFSLAVEGDGGNGGTVWAWGANSAGQLGDGSTSTRLVPVKTIGIDSAIQVTASYKSAYARLTDGSVRAWGDNDSGVLGNETTVDTPTVSAVSAITDSRTVTAHASNGLVLERGGRTWGLGTTMTCMFAARTASVAKVEPVPYLITNVDAAADAANTINASAVLRWDGTVWMSGWGYLGYGTNELYCGFRAVPGLSLAPNQWLMTDGDADNLATWREYELGTDPLDADTNDNGVNDGIEATQPESQPTPDDDEDGVPNTTEVANGTDPFQADTDGDGYGDGLDAFPLDSTRHDPLTPTPGDTTPPIITLTEPTTAVPRP